jgi:hypothetical protein
MSRVDDSGETDSPRSGQLAQRPRELSARETVQKAPLITNTISAPNVPRTALRRPVDDRPAKMLSVAQALAAAM